MSNPNTISPLILMQKVIKPQKSLTEIGIRPMDEQLYVLWKLKEERVLEKIAKFKTTWNKIKTTQILRCYVQLPGQKLF